MQLEKAVQIVGDSLVVLQRITRVASFEKKAGIWWYETQANLNAMLTNTDFTPLEVSSKARDLGVKKPLLIHQFLRVDTEKTELVAHFTNQGFDLTNQHYLMARETTKPLVLPQTWSVFRAETKTDATRISSVAQEILLTQKELPAQALGVRLYAAENTGEIIAWARIVQLQNGTAWLDNMFTQLTWRKRGVMASILLRINKDAFLFDVQKTLLFSAQSNYKYHLGQGAGVIAIKLRFAKPSSWFERIQKRFKPREEL